MRYLVLSDVHANLAALEAVLADAGEVDATWCLGDTVGYGPQPNECIERIRSLPELHCVAGNHDWGVLGKLSLADFNAEARYAAGWTASQLAPASRAWLEALPERIEMQGFTLVHGSPRHPIWEYVSDPSVAQANMEHFRTLTCLVGHTHVPAMYLEPGLRHQTAPTREASPGEALSYRGVRSIINPGGVGQPRDGDPRAAYLLLDAAAGTVELRRVDYDIAETQRLMQEAGLPVRLAMRLNYGL